MTTFRKPVPDRVKWVPASKCGKGWADVRVLKRLGYGSAEEGAEIARQKWLPAMVHFAATQRGNDLGYTDEIITNPASDLCRLYVNGKTKEELQELYAAARVLIKLRRDDAMIPRKAIF